MSERPPQARTFDSPSLTVKLELHTTVMMRSESGPWFMPKAKRARALLALIALSEAGSISRHLAAATLWSNTERSVGMARLRDLLHDMRKDFDEAGVDILDLQGDAILFRRGAVLTDIKMVAPEAETGSDNWSQFLVAFENIDPALDRWLNQIRSERRRRDVSSTCLDRVADTTTREEDRPSILIAEFDGIGKLAEADLARALTDEVGGALSRSRWFTTVTSNTSGQRLSVGGEDLSKLADYALIGTVQCDAIQYRLLLKLIDLSNGAIRFTSSFQQSRDSALLTQEQLAYSVAARVDVELLLAEIERQQRQPSSRRDSAYSLILQAIPGIYRLERDSFVRSGHLLEQAIIVNRESALAHSWLAYWHVFLVGQGWAKNASVSLAQAGNLADRAILLDPRDARAVTIAGHVKSFLGRRLDEGLTLHSLALQLNPGLALGWHLSGMTHAYAGRLDEAYRCISYCQRLAPNDPLGFFAEGALGIVHLLRHDHQSAVILGRRVTERHPNFTSAYKSYLAAIGHLGQKTEATRVLKRLLVLEPHFSLRRFHATAPYQRHQDLEHFTTGLRLAGVI